jgi:hypothetical protein
LPRQRFVSFGSHLANTDKAKAQTDLLPLDSEHSVGGYTLAPADVL